MAMEEGVPSPEFRVQSGPGWRWWGLLLGGSGESLWLRGLPGPPRPPSLQFPGAIGDLAHCLQL